MNNNRSKPNLMSKFVDIGQHIQGNPMTSFSIILINLYLIWGVLFSNWNIFNIMFLYWAENVLNGIFSVIRIASAKDGGLFKLFIIPFFCFHYGIFCFVHGVFVFASFGGAMGGFNSTVKVDSYFNGHFLYNLFSIYSGIGLSIYFFIINDIVSLVNNYFKNGEYLHANLKTLMSEPYGRIAQLHIGLMLGGFLTIISGSAKITICILIVLKVILDLNYMKNAKKNSISESEIITS